MASVQPERGDRPRRGGGSRQNRRRPSGRERQVEGRGGRLQDGQQRGGGGGSRGRGQGRRGRGASSSSFSAPPSSPQGNESAADDLELQGKEELGSYSCRKVVSNWHRYEDTEKETQNDSGESQRGTDFSVLLSSAGDSFTQFRFAEEKEWIVENLCPKQLSGLYVDCQSLVQALEELPLHLRLNVAAELVQDATPAILPQIKLKGNDVPKKSGGPLQQPLGQSTNPSGSYPAADSAAHLKGPNKDGLNSEALQKSPSSLFQETDNLDEDLDLLLKLDAPVNPDNNFELETLCPGIASGEDVKMPHEENDCLQLDGTEEICSAAQQEVTSKSITEEELEDWLDSMIS